MSRCGGEWLALFSLALMTACGGVVRPSPRALRARVERREAQRVAAEQMLERSCLSVLESDPALRGAVELEATVEQSGATRGVLISGDALDGELAPELETCLLTAMRRWRGEPGTLITIHPVFQTGRFLLSPPRCGGPAGSRPHSRRDPRPHGRSPGLRGSRRVGWSHCFLCDFCRRHRTAGPHGGERPGAFWSGRGSGLRPAC
jgi:hypothetical protein